LTTSHATSESPSWVVNSSGISTAPDSTAAWQLAQSKMHLRISFRHLASERE